MRWRDVEKQNQSPILRDCVRGTGGYGSGLFTMTSADNLPLDATSDVLGTESGEAIGTETLTPIKLTPNK